MKITTLVPESIPTFIFSTVEILLESNSKNNQKGKLGQVEGTKLYNDIHRSTIHSPPAAAVISG